MARSESEIMQPRTAPAGMTRYVYTRAELEEMAEVVILPKPGFPAPDYGNAVRACMALTGENARIHDAIRAVKGRLAPAPAPLAAPAFVAAKPAARSTGIYYGFCSCGCGSRRECASP